MNWHIPACLCAGSCSPPVGKMQMFTWVSVSALGLPGRVLAYPLGLECSLKRQTGSKGPLGAPFPSVGVTSMFFFSPLRHCLLSHSCPLTRGLFLDPVVGGSFYLLLRAQCLLPVPGAWVLCPLCQGSSSARHWGSGQSRITEARTPTLATWDSGDFGSQTHMLLHISGEGNGSCLMASPALS